MKGKKRLIGIITAIFGLSLVSLFSAHADTRTKANDTNYTISDVTNLQDFLLAKETPDLSEKNYDLNGDGIWDTFDLCLMKQAYTKQTTEGEQNTLVAYFSATGNTKKIAEYIVAYTGADSYGITPATPYTAEDLNYSNSSCRANQEQNDVSCRPEISGSVENMDNYDVVYIGYPIWWGEEPRIIDTFLESYDFSDKIVIPFCTSGSSSIAASENRIANLGVPIGNQLPGKRFSGSASEKSVSDWISTLDLPKQTTDTRISIAVNNHTLMATLADNSSAKAFAELLNDGPLTLDLHDYGNFEKTGSLPQTLPRNDEPIDTDFGDLILYQGNQFVLYYDKNSWTFTRLGHLDSSVTKEELKSILGEENVTVTISLAE
ncbi:flavodoxin family protein [Ruminococcus sp. CAG:403]|nr:flavodoxin family protein [Ruminococcus sp. CAG:403]